jgi:hypothetical protein
MEDINKLKEFFLSRRAATTAYESVKEQSEDAIDTITMDVPLFIRMLEYAREDASQDMDLHDVTEKAIALSKEVNVLQMEDYDEIIGAAKNTSKDKMDEAENVGQYYIQVSGQDANKALEVWEQEYSTMGIQKVAANLYQGSEFSDVYDLYWDLLSNGVRVVETNVDRPDLEERITEVLDKINEELCPAGKAYIKRRKAAGEKSSAYLSGRAVKVCKGLMSGKKKKK